MSGFLARLAERAVGTARSVRPRLPARFEGSGWEAAAEPAEGQTVGGEANEVREPAASASFGEQNQQGSEGPPHAAPRPPPAVPAMTASKTDVSPSPRPPSAIAPVAPRGEAVAPPVAAVEPPRRHQRPTGPAIHAAAEASPPLVQPAPAAAPDRPSPGGPPILHAESRRRASSTASPLLTDRSTAAAPPPPKPAFEPLPPPRRATTTSSRRDDEPLATAGADAPPPIRVTIGRVEVRAVAPERPAARPAPRRPAEPRLTLEEYQRRRRESLR